MLEVGAWGACLSVHDKFVVCASGGMVSSPGLYFWHWVVVGSVRCALCLAGHGVASCSVAGSRCMRSLGLLSCSASGMVLPVALTCNRE